MIFIAIDDVNTMHAGIVFPLIRLPIRLASICEICRVFSQRVAWQILHGALDKTATFSR